MLFSLRKLKTKPPGALDKLGASASFLCAIHCALMPIIVTLAPLMALSILASETFEWILFGISAILGTISICWGYRMHRSRKAAAMLACGLALLAAGRMLHQHHTHAVEAQALVMASHGEHSHSSGGADLYTIILVTGGLAVMASHLINHRLCQSCKKCLDDTCKP
jgi:hypothetical protein